ncbi:hypothetical protein AU512_15955 [Lonsdalea iberica]|uniref:Uncharacterized protein n=1 Tax=Lonsdalea iberica TaxID=1082703 RepID=A0ABX3XC55_9GAMM|nr:hypothetical protein [Lonsdalea iberica]OSN05015.1 hypothetical protein AU512_15955 [Lonsdalea iberica]
MTPVHQMHLRGKSDTLARLATAKIKKRGEIERSFRKRFRAARKARKRHRRARVERSDLPTHLRRVQLSAKEEQDDGWLESLAAVVRVTSRNHEYQHGR